MGSDPAFTYERQQEAQRKHREAMPTISDRDVAVAYERLESNPSLVREIERRRQGSCPERLERHTFAVGDGGVSGLDADRAPA